MNVLPRRPTLLEHMGDVKNHRCLVGGDSLPMHLALGMGVPCVTIFNCTSPWEIHDYGIQTKIVSPLLERFFYQRGHDSAATSAISARRGLRGGDGHAVMTPGPLQVGLLTGGDDKPYALGIASALVARGIRLDFIGSDAVDGPGAAWNAAS